jgi:hypothetical protein
MMDADAVLTVLVAVTVVVMICAVVVTIVEITRRK